MIALTIDEFTEEMQKLADELPEEFFDHLNMQIMIEETAKKSPEKISVPLYIMGEFVINALGRGIRIYYGSFEAVFGYLDRAALINEMRRVLRHEMRHHMESRAGLRDLEIIDRMDLDALQKKHTP
ncbi:metallopeptidase family protein [Eubacterium barkeri]|uniref:Zinicin-like metallopeptidase n=1 Tax=Eubacterium barkeri TaxID=1528 RepID=A0A1H3FJJ2_EUBBA|nr:metallopeptidase family protein [Eubacterium barkeri]SDX90548.1 Zinicin-like metallopeptidase [Eubacterium barkeri]